MAKIKFMGTSDVCTIAKGDDFGGRLSGGLTTTVTFNQANNWIVDTEELLLGTEEIQLLLEERYADGSPRFKDVTEAKRIPSNAHQMMFMAHPASEANTAVETDQAKPDGDGGADTPPAAGAPADDSPTTTVGGSTRGRGRAT